MKAFFETNDFTPIQNKESTIFKTKMEMTTLKYFYLFIPCFVFLSCVEDDLPETQDPNLFMGVWNLESSMINNTAETLSKCDKESTLILFWFSEADPFYNAEIYTYQANESG